MKRIILFVLLLAACNKQPTTAKWVVKMQPHVQQISNVNVLSTIQQLNVVVISSSKFPKIDPSKYEYIEPVRFIRVSPIPVSQKQEEWNIRLIRAPGAWDYSQGNGVTIAIVDTGIVRNRIEFSHLSTCQDFTGEGCGELNAHGTHVASIAAGNRFGIARDAQLMNIKALDSGGWGEDVEIAEAIVWATDHNADIINLSLGGSFPVQVLCDAVDYAVEQGVLVFAATGNNRGVAPEWPARCENAIAVGATNNEDRRAWFSNRCEDKRECVTAPGEAITAWTPNGVQTWSGTSMATPHLTGVGALMKALSPNITQNDMMQMLDDITVDLRDDGWDINYGYGRIDALLAIDKPPIPTPEQQYKFWLELIMRSESIYSVINKWRLENNLPILVPNTRLEQAAKIIASDGTYCPGDRQPLEMLIDKALYETGYKAKRGWVLVLCGEYPNRQDVLKRITRSDDLGDMGITHLANLDFVQGAKHQQGETFAIIAQRQVTDIWVLIMAEEES